MSFINEKRQFLSKPDKSSIKRIDKAILPLVKKINSNPAYYTTSSCSGRIILMKETGKKQENVFLFRSHEKVNFKEIKQALDSAARKSKGTIYIKHEPCIMHVACRNFDSAIKLVNTARNSGWKKSGIISRRNIIETLSTETLAAPAADKGKIITNDDYLKTLINECNKKLKQTKNKIKNLTISLKN
jgi:tRNA wybutosine-synthesizing protein 3